MCFVCGQHRQHVRGLARLVRFLVRYELNRFLVIVAILEIRPFALFIGSPERAAAICNLLAVFSDDRFYVNAARRGNRELISSIALAVGVYVGRSEFTLMQNVVVAGVLVAVVFLDFLFLLVLLFDELQGDFFRYRMAGVVRSLYADLRRVTLVI